ncbi:MAG: hypothetical protein IPG46_18085 [Actinobacteria bacterium]|nr:hypothetical protein [Actinomycetota bacterium]
MVDLTAGRPTKVHEVGPYLPGGACSGCALRWLNSGRGRLDIGDGVVEVTVLADPVLADPVLNATAGSGAAWIPGRVTRPDHATTGDSATAGWFRGRGPARPRDRRPALRHAERRGAGAAAEGNDRGHHRRSLAIGGSDRRVGRARCPAGTRRHVQVVARRGGRPLLASQGEGAADAARIAELFDEIHAAVLSDAPAQPIELDRLLAFTEAEGR